jgi:hypothetical protein
LPAALTVGQDARQIPRDRTAVDRQARLLTELEAVAEFVKDAQRIEQIEVAGMAFADAVTKRIASTLGNLPERNGPMSISIESEGIIATAAYQVARAQSDLARASAALNAAENTASDVASRLTTLQTATAAIIERRRVADARRDGGETISLLDTDGEGLWHILTEARAAATVARARVQHTQQTFGWAQQELKRTESAALMAALIEKANLVGATLHATLSQIEELRARVGGRPTWAPSRELYRLIRKGAASAGLL